MTIISAQAIPVSLPFEIGGPRPKFAGIPRQMDILLIRLETDQGLVGWGEAFGLAIWPATRQAFEHLVAPLVIGRDETDGVALSESLQKQLHILGRGGAVTYALSGLDIALWDLAGKAAGLPLSTLLGGAKHESLPVYASLMRYGQTDLVARNVEAALNKGFAAIKLHEVTTPMAQAAREVMGPTMDLMLDVNCPWREDQALAMAQELKACNLLWLEEPLWPPEDFAGLARLRQQCGLALAAGENNISTEHFAQMLTAGAVDYAQPSVTKIGGVTEFMKIVRLATQHGTPVMPHSPYFGPGLLATLHMTATFADETMIEYSYADLGASPLGPAVAQQGGRLRVPRGPGLGFDPDLDVVRQFRLP